MFSRLSSASKISSKRKSVGKGRSTSSKDDGDPEQAASRPRDSHDELRENENTSRSSRKSRYASSDEDRTERKSTTNSRKSSSSSKTARTPTTSVRSSDRIIDRIDSSTIETLPINPPSNSALPSTVPNQFPDQAPQDWSLPYRPPSASSLHPYGAAADFYNDTGESVQFQPGVRPGTPIVIGAEPHLMAALPISNPPSETGDGAAAEFFNVSAVEPSSMTVDNDIIADQSSSQAPSSKPEKRPGPTTHSSLPIAGAGAGGAVGISAAALEYQYHTQHHSNQTVSSQMTQPGFEDQSNGASAFMVSQGTYATSESQCSSQQHQHQGPISRFVDWWNDYSEVRKMEEYTEYIGVCRYCFDERSSIWDAPRKHHFRRRSSREFQNRTRVDKQSRYAKATASASSSDSEGWNNGIFAAGLSDLSLAAAASRRSQRKSENPLPRKGPMASENADREGFNSISRQEDSRVFDDEASEQTSSRRRSTRSVSPSRTSPSAMKASTGVALAAVGADFAGSSSRRSTKHSRRQSQHDNDQYAGSYSRRIRRRRESSPSPSSSSTSDEKLGFFGRLFSPRTKKLQRARQEKRNISSSRFNTGSSKPSGWEYGYVDQSRSTSKTSRRASSPMTASKAILGLSTAAALLAAAESKRVQAYIHPNQLIAVKEQRHTSAKRIRFKDEATSSKIRDRQSSDEVWEDASESEEDFSDVSSGLAFGADDDLPFVSANSKPDERLTTSRNIIALEERNRQRREFVARPSHSQSSPKHDGYSVSHARRKASSYTSPHTQPSPPLRKVDPIPIPESPSSSNSRQLQQVSEAPLHQPKPITPIRSQTCTDIESASEYGHRTWEISPSISRSQHAGPNAKSARTERGQGRLSSNSSLSTTRADPRHGKPDSTTTTTSTLKSKAPISDTIATPAAVGTLVSALVGTHEARKWSSSSPTTVTFADPWSRECDTSNTKMDNKESLLRSSSKIQSADPSAPTSGYDQEPDDKLGKVKYDVSEDARQPRRITYLYPDDATLLSYESEDKDTHNSEIAMGLVAARYATVEPKAPVVEHQIREAGQSRGPSEPIFDDDIFDPNFFKKKTIAASKPTVASAESVLADFEDRYNAPTQSGADFFGSSEFLASIKSPGTKRDAVDDEFDDNTAFRYPTSTIIPKLKVIPPTPPASQPGSVRDAHSRPPSPLYESVEAATMQETSASREVRRSVTWGDPEINVYQVETPESFRDEYFDDQQDLLAKQSSYQADIPQAPPADQKSEEKGHVVRTGFAAIASAVAAQAARDAAKDKESFQSPSAKAVSSPNTQSENSAPKQGMDPDGSKSGVQQDTETREAVMPGAFVDDEREMPVLDSDKNSMRGSLSDDREDDKDATPSSRNTDMDDLQQHNQVSLDWPGVLEVQKSPQKSGTENIEQGHARDVKFDIDVLPDQERLEDEDDVSPREDPETLASSTISSKRSKHAMGSKTSKGSTSKGSKKRGEYFAATQANEKSGGFFGLFKKSVSEGQSKPKKSSEAEQTRESEAKAISRKKSKKSNRKSLTEDASDKDPDFDASSMPSQLNLNDDESRDDVLPANRSREKSKKSKKPKRQSLSEDTSDKGDVGHYRFGADPFDEFQAVAGARQEAHRPRRRSISDEVLLDKESFRTFSSSSARKLSEDLNQTQPVERTISPESTDHETGRKSQVPETQTMSLEHFHLSTYEVPSEGGNQPIGIKSENGVNRRDTPASPARELLLDMSLDSLETLQQETSTANDHFDPAHDAVDDYHFPESYNAVPEMVRLPDSRPDSPYEPEGYVITKQIPHDQSNVVSPTTERASMTAVPLRFRAPPQSPSSVRDISFQLPPHHQQLVSSPTSSARQSGATRPRTSRPNSVEFKTSNEFRPLYLLETNIKKPELDPEEILPSLPSSRTSSILGSDENFESAVSSLQASPLAQGHDDSAWRTRPSEHVEPEYLNSQQATPRATSEQRELQEVSDLNLSEDGGHIDTSDTEQYISDASRVSDQTHVHTEVERKQSISTDQEPTHVDSRVSMISGFKVLATAAAGAVAIIGSRPNPSVDVAMGSAQLSHEEEVPASSETSGTQHKNLLLDDKPDVSDVFPQVEKFSREKNSKKSKKKGKMRPQPLQGFDTFHVPNYAHDSYSERGEEDPLKARSSTLASFEFSPTIAADRDGATKTTSTARESDAVLEEEETPKSLLHLHPYGGESGLDAATDTEVAPRHDPEDMEWDREPPSDGHPRPDYENGDTNSNARAEEYLSPGSGVDAEDVPLPENIESDLESDSTSFAHEPLEPAILHSGNVSDSKIGMHIAAPDLHTLPPLTHADGDDLIDVGTPISDTPQTDLHILGNSGNETPVLIGNHPFHVQSAMDPEHEKTSRGKNIAPEPGFLDDTGPRTSAALHTAHTRDLVASTDSKDEPAMHKLGTIPSHDEDGNIMQWTENTILQADEAHQGVNNHMEEFEASSLSRDPEEIVPGLDATWDELTTPNAQGQLLQLKKSKKASKKKKNSSALQQHNALADDSPPSTTAAEMVVPPPTDLRNENQLQTSEYSPFTGETATEADAESEWTSNTKSKKKKGKRQKKLSKVTKLDDGDDSRSGPSFIRAYTAGPVADDGDSEILAAHGSASEKRIVAETPRRDQESFDDDYTVLKSVPFDSNVDIPLVLARDTNQVESGEAQMSESSRHTQTTLLTLEQKSQRGKISITSDRQEVSEGTPFMMTETTPIDVSADVGVGNFHEEPKQEHRRYIDASTDSGQGKLSQHSVVSTTRISSPTEQWGVGASRDSFEDAEIDAKVPKEHSHDMDFIATVAAGLENSGFDPQIMAKQKGSGVSEHRRATTRVDREGLLKGDVMPVTAASSSWPIASLDAPLQPEIHTSDVDMDERPLEEGGQLEDSEFDDIIALGLGKAGFDPMTAVEAVHQHQPSRLDESNLSIRAPSPSSPSAQWQSAASPGADEPLTGHVEFLDNDLEAQRIVGRDTESGSSFSSKKKKQKKKARKEARASDSQPSIESQSLLPAVSSPRSRTEKNMYGKAESAEDPSIHRGGMIPASLALGGMLGSALISESQATPGSSESDRIVSALSTSHKDDKRGIGVPDTSDRVVAHKAAPTSVRPVIRYSGYHGSQSSAPANRMSTFGTEQRRKLEEDTELSLPTSPVAMDVEPSLVERRIKERTSTLFAPGHPQLAPLDGDLPHPNLAGIDESPKSPTVRSSCDVLNQEEHGAGLEHVRAAQETQGQGGRSPMDTIEENMTDRVAVEECNAGFDPNSATHEMGHGREEGILLAMAPASLTSSPLFPEMPMTVRKTTKRDLETNIKSSPITSEFANTRRRYTRSVSNDSQLMDQIRSRTPGSAVSHKSNSSTTTNNPPRRSTPSADLGAEYKHGLAHEQTPDVHSRPPSRAVETPPNYAPLKGSGKDRRPDMVDQGIFEGWGDGQGSPRSPTRPKSVRKRQSTQILELENRLEQVVEENRVLQQGRGLGRTTENTSSPAHLTDALRARDEQLRQKDVEINSIRANLSTLEQEVERLSEHNVQLRSGTSRSVEGEQHIMSRGSTDDEHWQSSSRELQALGQYHSNLSAGMDVAVARQVSDAVAGKDAEIRTLQAQLAHASDKIRSLQQQILASKRSDDSFLNTHDEDYFESACQQLCQHVQQWVLRFSKFSDMRVCRSLSELRNEDIENRLDNALLDGTDVDVYLADRVRRRDVFMSIVMTMIWEFVFTRYLFGMDREQRQKLKNLEKILTEVGPQRAVAQWRATTLTLLSRRPAFETQREQDTEAVVQEIYVTLAALLPPPHNLIDQVHESLRNVMRLAVGLSIDMRTQRAEYMMLPPLRPEYDENGDLKSKVSFNASLMNERSGEFESNEELQRMNATVRLVLFPLVVKKGDDNGDGDEEIVIAPAQVQCSSDITKKSKRVMSGHNRSTTSVYAPSILHDADG